MPVAGAEGEAIYIDTEGSFIIERVAEIAEAAVRHIQVGLFYRININTHLFLNRQLTHVGC